MQLSAHHIVQSLEQGEFVPCFQPLVDLRSGEIHGFEILARWQHPTLGLISPGVFIPLIEQYRLANNLTASLLISAFAEVRSLPQNFGLSVNVSPAQLHDRSLPKLIDIIAEEAEFDLSRLTVELTESALVDDLELAGSVARQLKQRGMRLALDDFGTGYSSLLHLQSLPFDELKVDASFVRSITETRQSRKITAAVIGLGLSLGLTTVAEGIEHQSQANLLAWQGCSLGQGFLYGKAVPAAELLGILARPEPFPGVNTEAPPAISSRFLSVDAQPTERFSQLRAIYDGAPVGLGFVNTQLRYVNLNQRLAQSNNKPIESHLGRKVSEVLSPELYAQVEPFLHRALQGESLRNIEFSSTPIAGEPARTLMVCYEPVRDEAGEILGVCISVADISALKQKEQALRESEDHYRHTVELNPQIPWVADPDGNVISISSRWHALTGKPAENRDWLECVHPEDRPLAVAAVQHCLRTGDPLDIEYRVQSEGRWLWMRGRGYPRRDENGRIIRWYGSAENIDEHKRAVDELRCGEARLRALFQAAPVGIVLVESSTGRVLRANPHAEQLVGFRFTPDMVWSHQGWHLFDSNGNHIPEASMPLTSAMRTGRTTRSEEILLRDPDGRRRWLNITAAPVRLENGTQWGAVMIVQDIEADVRRDEQRLLELTGLSRGISNDGRASAIASA
ncbi:MAG TPA: EAL domain-containing protein [Acidobacteriaceae bacterium]|nr:EAL domain-containing protein [Acidobacteriaceae bacterium]